MRYDNIVIDTNLLYYKNYATNLELYYTVNNKKILTGGIYGSIRSINKLKRDYLAENGTIWCIFDNATSKQNMRQKMIDPYYKANRSKKPKSFYRSLDYLRLILMNYSDDFKVVYGTGFEADDLAPNVLEDIHVSDTVLLVSEDLDWSRFIEYEKRPIHQLMKKEVYDSKLFNKKYNFLPTLNKIVLYKTITGDKSDNIPIGVPNIPKAKVIYLIENYDNIYDLLERIPYDQSISKKWKKDFSINNARLRLNYQLVSFIPINQDYYRKFVSNSKFKPLILEKIYKSLGFNLSKIDTRVHEFILKKQFATNKYMPKRDSFFREPNLLRK